MNDKVKHLIAVMAFIRYLVSLSLKIEIIFIIISFYFTLPPKRAKRGLNVEREREQWILNGRMVV
jgi:hypothetical protein